MSLSAVDAAVIGLYLVVVVGIGFWVGRKKRDTDGFLLGERSSVWPLIGFSLMAANLSGTSYLGLAGAGYHDGIAVWTYEWMATLILIFFALFVLPFYLRSKVATMPEFLEQRYDRRSRYVFSAFSVFTAMFIDSAGALYAGAIAATLLFPGVPFWVFVVGLAVIAGVYVMAGGLRAVMITDTMQGVLMLVAGAVLFGVGLDRIGGWHALEEVAPDDLSMMRPPSDDFLPWPGIYTGVVWIGFYYWTTNHVVVQKTLSAKSVDHGRWGALLAGFLQLPFLFLLILPGTMGRALHPDLPQPDQIWPALVFDLLPVGARGFALAALLAALMSTLDSVLNGAASLVVNDFVKTRRRWKPSDAKLLLFSRALIGLFVLAAAAWAPQILRFEGIVVYFQSFLGHLTPPVVVVFLGGLFWKRATRHAALVTLVLGPLAGLAAFVASEVAHLYELQFLYATGLVLLGSAALFITVSLFTEAPAPEKTRTMTWSREHWKAESEELAGKPKWKNYRVQALVLACTTVVMVWLFW